MKSLTKFYYICLMRRKFSMKHLLEQIKGCALPTFGLDLYFLRRRLKSRHNPYFLSLGNEYVSVLFPLVILSPIGLLNPGNEVPLSTWSVIMSMAGAY